MGAGSPAQDGALVFGGFDAERTLAGHVSSPFSAIATKTLPRKENASKKFRQRPLRSTTDSHLVRELRSGEPAGPVYASSVLAFSHDGELLATGGSDGKIRLWRVDDGKLLKTYSGHGYNEIDHTSSVLAVAFFPDGQHIASHGSDETIRIWPVEERGS